MEKDSHSWGSVSGGSGEAGPCRPWWGVWVLPGDLGMVSEQAIDKI